jgi:tRNA dimethylallyltransferase
MIDIVNPDEAYSVAEFQKSAFSLIETSNAKGETPVVAGGTGLYINSLVYSLNFGTSCSDDNIRQKFAQLADDKSTEYLYNILEKKDPEYAKIIARTDKRRIIRRLEIIETKGESEYNFRQPSTDDAFLIIGLTMPRDILYKRINARVDDMIQMGLVEEAHRVYDAYGDINALKAIGYKELIAYFKGETGLDEAVSLIKRNTRRFAKRQMTWFKRDERIVWFDVCTHPCIEHTINDIMLYIKGKGF